MPKLADEEVAGLLLHQIEVNGYEASCATFSGTSVAQVSRGLIEAKGHLEKMQLDIDKAEAAEERAQARAEAAEAKAAALAVAAQRVLGCPVLQHAERQCADNCSLPLLRQALREVGVEV